MCMKKIFIMIFMVGFIQMNSFAAVDLSIIAKIESSGREKAIGDGGRSLGMFQLSKAVIAEWNQFHPHDKKTHSDALDARIAHDVASWYVNVRIPHMLRHFKLEVSHKNIIWSYNCGIKCVVDGRTPPITKDYLRKYQAMGGTL